MIIKYIKFKTEADAAMFAEDNLQFYDVNTLVRGEGIKKLFSSQNDVTRFLRKHKGAMINEQSEINKSTR